MTYTERSGRESTEHRDAATEYTHRLETNRAACGHLANRSRAISYARVSTFLVAAACAIVAVTSPGAPTRWLLAAGGLFLAGFAALVAWHSDVERRERRHEALADINETALRKLRRDWSHLVPPAAAAPPSHPYADDLDLFGRASLFELLWNDGSESGRRRLADWLAEGSAPDTVRTRQDAVAELAPLVDLRQEMLAAARTASLGTHEAERFLDWAESPPWLSAHWMATWAIRGLAVGILLLVMLQATGIVQESYWLGLVGIAFLVSNLFARRIHDIFNRAFAQYAVFRSYADLFRLVSSVPFRSSLLRELQAALVVGRLTAERQMTRLQRFMELADLRRSALLHLPVQVMTLWDFHVVWLVERWQARAGRMARRWFDALATFEALAALAGLRFDNPSWTFAEIGDTGGGVLEGAALGHPLLPPDARVDNDVRIGPPGTFLLVTGSNMSGKSTLLRAVGVNIVLAQAGAPCCAARLRLPPLRLYTSMRVQDSLEQGTSFFMAAVKRLKQVVEAADARFGTDADTMGEAAPQPPRLLLYLLDEVLQGTNTAERQIAVRSIVRHLLARPAIGAITTHDLTLAATPEFATSAQLVHFTEHLEDTASGAVMSFDYRLRPGLATSRNALRLMRMVGLEVPRGDEESRN